jgi:D-arginine dehydrogenase
MNKFDFAIVGAGIAGASLAYKLAAKGSVLLLEREAHPAMHSTGRSAAMFMETYGSPQARALTRASRAFYEQPPRGFCDAPILSPRGALYVAWAGQEKILDEQFRILQSVAPLAHPVRRLEPAEVIERVAVLNLENMIGAILEPDAMDIDVNTLHQGYLRGAKQGGATTHLKTELESALFHAEKGVWHIACRDGSTFQADVIINAAGAWADECALRCGAKALGIQPKRRSAFIFEGAESSGKILTAQDTAHWPTFSGIEVDWYIKPDAGLLLGSPANADPVPAHDVQAEDLDIAQAIAEIEAHTSLRIRRPKRVWAGLRSFAPDDELVIGWDVSCERFFWLAGQGGYGIQSADGAADLATHLILEMPLSNHLKEHGVESTATSPGRAFSAETVAQRN